MIRCLAHFQDKLLCLYAEDARVVRTPTNLYNERPA